MSLWAWLEAQSFLLWTIGAASLGMMLLGLAAVPWIVSRMPRDYFLPPKRRPLVRKLPLGLNLLILCSKNLLGFACLLAGLAMLFLPGQGILTILIGLGLMNFPGKFTLQRRLVQSPSVMRSLNWIRGRFGQPPFHSPDPYRQS